MVKLNRSQAVNVNKLLTIRYLLTVFADYVNKLLVLLSTSLPDAANYAEPIIVAIPSASRVVHTCTLSPIHTGFITSSADSRRQGYF